MKLRIGCDAAPKDKADKPKPAGDNEHDDEDDGDIATPKRDRDDEADAFERGGD